ncbi:glycosyltransferase family 2 protein [Sphingobacterium griseoflavum]|uniref:Glycosyl transferase n=1 Tax=Sphingobacterium griseoflavum TaxID=1474952 RepID=A0ABQ3HVM3_9SPHI|nr:glycosyltransferase [Sphingobacterium griseoflavum]GHE39065.1 glycosyl transferase [Sphingobacterium griseoflavum]
MSKLAVVIPAYKPDFLEEALESLKAQTNTEFVVYVGDDFGPSEIKIICDRYRSDLKLFYVRFDSNMGGSNLVGQWNRCLEMVQDEEWVWLFSDDDTLDENCVQSFYEELNSENDHIDIFHYNINIIDDAGTVKSAEKPFPELLDVESFILQRSSGVIKSYVVEYIFKKEILTDLGGFVDFPTAWHSDEATVMYAARKGEIKTINGARVNWRSSPYNITPNAKNKDVVLQKVKASVEFASWLYHFMKENNLNFSSKLGYYMCKRFSYELYMYRRVLPFTVLVNYLVSYHNNLRIKSLLPLSFLMLLKYELFKSK